MSEYFTNNSLRKYMEDISKLERDLRNVESQTQEAIESGGDCWHDNAGYEQVVLDLRVKDSRLNEAYRLLNNAKIVEYPDSVDKVVLGTRVHVFMDDTKKTYEIVAHGDVDVLQNRILYSSPLAKSLLGREPDDYFVADINGRKKEIEILDIEPLDF